MSILRKWSTFTNEQSRNIFTRNASSLKAMTSMTRYHFNQGVNQTKLCCPILGQVYTKIQINLLLSSQVKTPSLKNIKRALKLKLLFFRIFESGLTSSYLRNRWLRPEITLRSRRTKPMLGLSRWRRRRLESFQAREKLTQQGN